MVGVSDLWRFVILWMICKKNKIVLKLFLINYFVIILLCKEMLYLLLIKFYFMDIVEFERIFMFFIDC